MRLEIQRSDGLWMSVNVEAFKYPVDEVLRENESLRARVAELEAHLDKLLDAVHPLPVERIHTLRAEMGIPHRTPDQRGRSHRARQVRRGGATRHE